MHNSSIASLTFSKGISLSCASTIDKFTCILHNNALSIHSFLFSWHFSSNAGFDNCGAFSTQFSNSSKPSNFIPLRSLISLTAIAKPLNLLIPLVPVNKFILFQYSKASSLYSSKSYDFTNSGPNELKCFEFIVSIAQPSESIHIKKSFSFV